MGGGHKIRGDYQSRNIARVYVAVSLPPVQSMLLVALSTGFPASFSGHTNCSH